jgi:hypothetical protein
MRAKDRRSHEAKRKTELADRAQRSGKIQAKISA